MQQVRGGVVASNVSPAERVHLRRHRLIDHDRAIRYPAAMHNEAVACFDGVQDVDRAGAAA